MIGKKMKIRKIKNRVLSTFCLVLIFVAVFPFGIFAATMERNGTFSDGTNWVEFFGASETPMLNMLDSAETFVSSHGNNVEDLNNIGSMGLTRANEETWAGIFDNVKDFEDFQIYNTLTVQNVDYDLTDSTYHVIFGNDGNSNVAYCYYFWTENHHPVYFVGGRQGNAIVSDDELHCYMCEFSTQSQYYTNAYAEDYYISENQGVYYMPFSAISAGSGSTPILLTDLSIFWSTQSGNSGFTSSGFSGGTADFDFANVSSYYDFNLPKTSGDFTDPNAPEPEPEQTLARYYLNFADTTSYTGNSFNAVYHNHSLNLNEYTMQFPQQFELGFDYIVYLDTPYFGGTRVYRYAPENKVQIAYLLGQCKRLGTGTKLSVPLNFDNFICTADGNTLSFDLRSIYHNQFSTVMSAIQVDDLLDSSAISYGGQSLGTGSRSFGGFQIGNFTSISDGIDKIKTAIASSFRQFKIVGYVSLYDKSDSNYHSYSYHDFHDFLTGEEGALDTNNTIAPYERPEGLNEAQIVESSGGGVVSGGSNNVTVTVQGGAGSGAQLVKVWTPFTLSEVSYANTHGMFQDILEFMDASSENGFLPVVKQVFSFLPDTIWTYLTISIACICGFAIVRFALKR